jgi:hypothetical protein
LTGPDPGLIYVVAPDIGGDWSSFYFFGLIFTEEIFNTILTETNHYQQHTSKDKNRTLQTDVTVNKI